MPRVLVSAALLLVGCFESFAPIDGGPDAHAAERPATAEELRAAYATLARAYCESDIEVCIASYVHFESVEACLAHNINVAPSAPVGRAIEETVAALAGLVFIDEAALECHREQTRRTCVGEDGLSRGSQESICGEWIIPVDGLPEGARCASSPRLCAPGLRCRTTELDRCLADRRCGRYAAEGEPCENARQCEATLGRVSCVEDPAGQRRCLPAEVVAPSTDGARCGLVGVVDGVAQVASCAPGLICDFSEICVRPGAPGEPCTGALGKCLDGAVCVDDECVALPRATEGGACDETCVRQAGLACDPDSLTCTATTGAIGEPCDDPFTCQPGSVCPIAPPFISTGRCRAEEPVFPLPDGEPCRSAGDCLSECCDAETCVPRAP